MAGWKTICVNINHSVPTGAGNREGASAATLAENFKESLARLLLNFDKLPKTSLFCANAECVFDVVLKYGKVFCIAIEHWLHVDGYYGTQKIFTPSANFSVVG